MSKNAIILFDLDGTLIDSTPAIYFSFSQAYKEHRLQPPSLESVKQSIGHTLEDMFLAQGVPKDKVSEFIKSYRLAYRAQMEAGTTLLPNAKEAIILGYEFAHLGIVTTKRGDFSAKLLESFGVLHYFSVIVGIENVSNPKPHSEPIICALDSIREMRKCDIAMSSCFMVGDTILDLQAAKNAGITGVGVLCGYGDSKSLQQHTQNIHQDALAATKHIQAILSI